MEEKMTIIFLFLLESDSTGICPLDRRPVPLPYFGIHLKRLNLIRQLVRYFGNIHSAPYKHWKYNISF
jgi:hypothetical protein